MTWRRSSTLAAALAASLYSSYAAAAAGEHKTSLPISTSDCLSRVELDRLSGTASAALEQAQYAVAINILQPVSMLDCDARINLLLAAAYESSNDLLEARRTLEHAHSVWPADSSIATSLAREYLGEGDQAGAAKALDHFHASSTTPWQEIQLSIVVFLSTHQLAAAEDAAQLGYKWHPSLDSLLLLANTLQLEGRYKDVIALLNSNRESYAASAKFLVTIAESEYDANVFDHARADVEKAISLDKSLYQAHYLLGNILMKQGDAKPAATAYQVALTLAPDQPRTYYHLALAMRAMHDEAGEESVLARAVALNADYGLAHCELGRIFLNQNRVTEAVSQLELAVRDNASSEEAYSLLARAYDKQGERTKAEEAATHLAAARKANHQARPMGSENHEKAASEITRE